MLKHVSHVLILAIIALMSVMAVSPFAHGESAQSNTPIIPAPPQLAAEGYLLLDAATGHILVEHNSKQRLPPASLTKIMTSFVAAEEMDRGTLSDNDEVDISVKAWKMEGSRMFIQEGTKVPVELLMKGIIIQSGNDASVAMAEHIAGGEDAFADVMNQHAKRLGMNDTHFMNATGLPDEEHYTTASDLAKLTVALINQHPEHYKLYSEKSFSYNEINQNNRNTLLWGDKSVDGVKTGHTEAAGYCLVASAVRNNTRLISVVMGTNSVKARASESQKLLSYGFRYFETVRLYDANEMLNTVRLWEADSATVSMGLSEAVAITIPRGAKGSLTAAMDIESVIRGPVTAGQELGQLTVSMGGETVYQGALVALKDIPAAGFFKGIWHSLSLFFLQLFGGDPLKIP
jgi:D-alanyl-D-alanine carboxypeptidase (penicillin-binding protein 5/6)